MKERFKKIMNVLYLVIFSIAALWEYMQFFMYYDLPQIVVILPIIGLLAAVALKKWSFLLLGTTTLMAVVFQLIEDPQDGLGYVDTSKITIILKILPAVLLFLLIGIVAGLLVRMAFRKDRHISLRTWGVVGTCRRNCFVPQPIVPVCCETSDSPICAEVRQEGVPGK